MSVQLFGFPVARGIAIGRAVLVASSRVDVAHYFVEAERRDAEVDRLRRARDTVASELSTLQRDLPPEAPVELSALLDVHLLLLHDESMIAAIKQLIHERHYNAEWALSAQLEVLARQFDEMEDDYFRERKADIEQVAERLLRALERQAGRSTPGTADAVRPHAAGDDDQPLILVANDIAPADMLNFKRSVFTGFVTDVGGKTSHTAIVARSLHIPAVVGAREASRVVRQDDLIIVDGDAGLVIVDPSPHILAEYRARQQEDDRVRSTLAGLRHMPAVTRDGEPVELLANIELPGDAAAALAAGAVGVGLFRSEFLFMNRGGQLPGEDEQFEAYRAAVQTMNGLPVTIRTVDIGADKPLDRMSASELRRDHALNPALGLRAIRWSLSEPSMFRQQLRAILRAGAYGKVRILIPMVAHLSEVRQTLDALARARQQLTDARKPFGHVEIGAMVEVPASALTLPAFLKHFDFVSVGTNDLIQYTLAIDRADEAVAHLYDPWHPAVLRLLALVIEQARAAGKHLSICGEMAGDVEFTDLLLGMGLRSLSMHPARIAAVKQRVLEGEALAWSKLAPQIVNAEEPEATFRHLAATRARSFDPATATA